MKQLIESLRSSVSPGAEARLTPTGKGFLGLPFHSSRQYRLAQLDDYGGSSRSLARSHFPWRPPLQFKIRARASHTDIPGTWGFGFWNDPLSLSLGFGSRRRLPAFPNTVWFFFASPENYLSMRDDLPAYGALAATFRAPTLPVLLYTPGVLALPLLFFRPTARFLRRIAARIVRQDSICLSIDPAEWHEYSFDWQVNQVTFRVNGEIVLGTPISPRGPLGLVIWMDNQFAAWNPDGRMKWGLLTGKQKESVEFEALSIL